MPGQMPTNHPVPRAQKNLALAYVLLVTLGWAGAHRFYFGRWLSALAFPALSIATFICYVTAGMERAVGLLFNAEGNLDNSVVYTALMIGLCTALVVWLISDAVSLPKWVAQRNRPPSDN